MRLIIIRHAETNRDASLPGEPDALTQNGHAQIKELVTACRIENVEAIVHSRQARAASTVVLLAKELSVPSIECQGLEERNFGDWDKWEWPQIAAELDKLDTDERYSFVPPNGESWQQMETRLRNALRRISKLPYESVAVVTHWGSIRALLPILKNEPKESTLRLNVTNGQSFIINYDGSNAG